MMIEMKIGDDLVFQVDISDALSEKEKVKFTVHTRTGEISKLVISSQTLSLHMIISVILISSSVFSSLLSSSHPPSLLRYGGVC